MSSQNTRRP